MNKICHVDSRPATPWRRRAPLACFAAGLTVVGGAHVATAGSGTILDPIVGEPLNGLSDAQLEAFNQGREDYNFSFEAEDGLGPIFNKKSCGNCHNNPVGGTGTQTVTRFFSTGKKGGFDSLEQFGGPLLQQASINETCQEVVPDGAQTTLRRTKGMLGYGLVEAIPDQAIFDNETAQESDPNVSGRVSEVIALEDQDDGGPLRPARFGWKLGHPTVLSFSADATRNEIGITNRLITTENDPNGINPPSIEECDTIPDPEDGPDENGLDFIDRVTNFQRLLAPPPQTPSAGMTGEALFNQIGCNVCHVPSYTTVDDAELESPLRNREIKPYSDFLLHDMGLNGDPMMEGNATQREVGTPPLWGVANKQSLWHNGSVFGSEMDQRLFDAINMHDSLLSEAQPSAQAFNALSENEQDQVIAFLGSLGRAQFDVDRNNEIELDDFHGFGSADALLACFGTTGDPDDPNNNWWDNPCAIHDVDEDFDVDLDDLHLFLIAWGGPLNDCNTNGVTDLVDIAQGLESDEDFNGIPDSCQPTCDFDLDGTGDINVSDLLAMLGQWGACPDSPQPCSADVNQDGTVNVSDLLGLLSNWGSCP